MVNLQLISPPVFSRDAAAHRLGPPLPSHTAVNGVCAVPRERPPPLTPVPCSRRCLCSPT